MKYNNTKLSVCAIFATDLDGGMGFQGSMPWPRLSDDLKNFRRLTLECLVLMGSKTWTSTDIRAPLPQRKNIVWSRNHSQLPNITDQVVQLSDSPDVCLDTLAQQNPSASQLWIIGGAETLKAWMPWVSTVWHTEIYKRWDCDVRFHKSHWQPDFAISAGVQRYRDYESGIEYTISVWNR